MNKIEVPFVRQTLKDSCGPACIGMLLKFHGEKLGKNKADRGVIRKFGFSKYRGMFFEEEVWALAKRGYNVILLTNFEGYRGKTKKEILANIKKSIKTWKPGLREKATFHGRVPKNEVWGLPIIKAVKSGKCRTIFKPQLSHLKKFVKLGKPPIVAVDWNELYNVKGDIETHAVVVTGFDKKNVYVTDPIKGRKKISIKRFVRAWSLPDCYGLVLEGSK